MGCADEEWVKAAMTDDAMVVELLVHLHRAPPPPQPPRPPLEWSVRQRRSKSSTVNNHPKKPARNHRGSPTTPLSWSGGATSFSGGSEDSSLLTPCKLSSSTRSKVYVDGDKTNSKRSRKKKTLTELKDEESSLLKERRELKREMAALRMNLERQRSTNEKLKRMKIDLEPTSIAEESVSGQLQQESTSSHPTKTTTTSVTTTVVSGHEASMSNVRYNENADAASDAKFILPDLNIAFGEPSSDGIS